MKACRAVFGLATAILILTAQLCAEEAAQRFAGSKIAVIDIEKALAEYRSYQDEIAAITSVTAAIERQYPSQEPSCGTSPLSGGDRDFVQKLKHQFVAPHELQQEIEKRREQVAEQRQELRARLDDLERQRNEATINAYAEIQREAAKFCHGNGIKLVIRSDPIFDADSFSEKTNRQDVPTPFGFCQGAPSTILVAPSLVFSNVDRIDITTDIIRRLNGEADEASDLPKVPVADNENVNAQE